MAMVLSEEQELLKDSARDFVKANVPVSHLRELRDNKDADGFSKTMWKQVAELGWAGILFPEEFGGAELGMAELGVVMEECGRTLAPRNAGADCRRQYLSTRQHDRPGLHAASLPHDASAVPACRGAPRDHAASHVESVDKLTSRGPGQGGTYA